MSVPRAAFMAVGGFALDLPRCYDVELAYRLERHGLSFVYIEQAKGVQDERKGLQALIVDSEESGEAGVEISRRHPPTLPQFLGTFNRIRPRERLLYQFRPDAEHPGAFVSAFWSDPSETLLGVPLVLFSAPVCLLARRATSAAESRCVASFDPRNTDTHVPRLRSLAETASRYVMPAVGLRFK